MTDQKNKQEQALAPAATNGGHVHSDEESGKKLRQKKRMRCLIYIVIFAIFQVGIITLFALTVMKIKNPKFRIGEITMSNMNTTASSLDANFTSEITVKNTNFGHYKFEESTASFTYGGMGIGQVVIPKGRARARSTKRMEVMVQLRGNGVGNGNGNEKGLMVVNGKGKMKGKVILLKVIKTNKSVEMDCVITINLSSKIVQDLQCK